MNANGTGEVTAGDRALHAPAPGTRCKRCHRIAPQQDGIPCHLCAPDPTGRGYTAEAALERHQGAVAEVGRAQVGLFVDALASAAARTDMDDGWGS